jgi:hypothetical protein
MLFILTSLADAFPFVRAPPSNKFLRRSKLYGVSRLMARSCRYVLNADGCGIYFILFQTHEHAACPIGQVPELNAIRCVPSHSNCWPCIRTTQRPRLHCEVNALFDYFTVRGAPHLNAQPMTSKIDLRLFLSIPRSSV